MDGTSYCDKHAGLAHPDFESKREVEISIHGHESSRGESSTVYSVYDQTVDDRISPAQEHGDKSTSGPLRKWSHRQYVPLEPGPLGVQIIRERCCDKDVAQRARAVSNTYKPQHLP